MSIHWDSLASVAWNQIWQVTAAVVLVAAIVRLCCRHRPHLAYLLWMLVVVKCLTPPLWSSPTGVFSWAQAEVSADEGAAHPTVFNETVEFTDTSPLVEDESETEAFLASPLDPKPTVDAAPIAAVTETRSAPTRRSINWITVLMLTWASGAALVLLAAFTRLIACSLVVRRSCRVANDALQLHLAETAKRLGIKRKVRLLVTRRPLGPAVFGVIRPTILIPESLVAAKAPVEIMPILAHELIHFRRGDTLVGWFQLFAQSLWWFHPLVWWASREASRERERCCDEESIAGLNCEPSSYAQALIDVLNQKRRLRPVFGSPAVRAVEITTRRLQHIMRDDDRFHRQTPWWCWAVLLVCAALLLPGGGLVIGSNDKESNEVQRAFPLPVKPKPDEWNQFGGSSHRNNTPEGENAPTQWDVEKKENIRWTAKLGSSVFNSPVVADGKVFIGTNNNAGYIKHYPKEVDLSVLLCFDEKSGDFLWQYSIEKLFPDEPAKGRQVDWPLLGLCSVPMVDGDRLWVVTTRCEVVCLDIDGFRDDQNDGPFKDEPRAEKNEADVIWKYDMIGELGVIPHNLSNCSVTCAGDLLLVGTSNGVDQSHAKMPAPHAPSFIALDRNTGHLVWKDSSPGGNILHGQWSSPAYGVFEGVPQAIFAGGDGWLYSFDLRDMRQGKTNLLWWFDCNPKESEWISGARGTRNNILATPVIYDGLVYVAVGQDLEHGEGDGRLWCINPTKRGDISTELVYNERDPKTPIAHKRRQACEKDKGDFVRENPNSGAVWHYEKADQNGDGKIDFEESMHRSVGSATIKNGLLVVADTSGLVHCLDAKSGEVHWTHDLYASSSGTPLIVDGKIYLGDEDGDLLVLKLSKKLNVINEVSMGSSINGSAVFARDTLYVAMQNMLVAITAPANGDEKDAAKDARRESTQPHFVVVDGKVKVVRSEDELKSLRKPADVATPQDLQVQRETNTRVLRKTLPDQFSVNWQLDLETGFESTPILDNGIIYATDIDGHLYAVDAKAGEVLWRFSTGVVTISTPAVKDNRVYFGDGNGRFYCVDVLTGKQEWSFQTDREINGSPNFWNDRLLFGSQDAHVYCLNALTGKLLWKSTTDDQIRTKPIVVGEVVAVSGCAQKLYIFNVQDGRELATLDIGSATISTPAVRGTRLYVGTEQGAMFCIDLETMREVWKFQTDGGNGAIRTSPSVTETLVIFGCRDKRVYALDRKTGEKVWTFAANQQVDSSPIVVGERIYFGSDDGRVRSLNLMTGEKAWEQEIGGSILGSVAVDDGVMVVTTDRGVIYSFGAAKNVE